MQIVLYMLVILQLCHILNVEQKAEQAKVAETDKNTKSPGKSAKSSAGKERGFSLIKLFT